MTLEEYRAMLDVHDVPGQLDAADRRVTMLRDHLITAGLVIAEHKHRLEDLEAMLADARNRADDANRRLDAARDYVVRLGQRLADLEERIEK